MERTRKVNRRTNRLSKGQKNVDGVTVLFLCTSSDDGLYFNKVSWKYSGRYQSYRAYTVVIRNISKGHNSIKSAGGVTVLVLCISSYDGLYLYQVSWKYLERYQSYGADTKNNGRTNRLSKGHNSIRNEDGVTVLFLCSSSDGGLYFYKVSWEYFGRYQSYRADTVFIRKISIAIIP